MKKRIFSLLMMMSFGFSIYSQALNEGFGNVAGLIGNGWNMQNLSTPIGSNPNWVQGDPVNMPFAANSLPSNSYIAVNYNSVAGTATISNWLITPMLNLNNGDVLSFYTRGTGSIYADNLQVRLSTSGSSTNVGASNISVGDFSNLLLEINPTLNAASYPSTWTQYTITISGLASPTTGRIGFRYYVPNGGPTGNNSDLIGIDDVVYTPAPICNMSVSIAAYNSYGGGNNGSMTATASNGTGPYTYSWASGQGTSSINNLSPGQYAVTVTDAQGCSASSNATIFNLAGPTVLSNSNVVSSYQVVNGGFTPQWVCQNDTLYTDGGIMNIYLEAGATMITGGGIDSIFAKSGSTIIMTGGIHRIYHEPGVNLVMNGGIPYLYPCPSLVFNYSQAPANGCAPVPVCNLTATSSVSAALCHGENTGAVDITTTGAANPVSFQWSNGSMNEDLLNVSSGTYTVTIIDANGCTVSQTATVTEPTMLTVNATIIDPILCNGGTGTIDVSGNGGTAPYTGTGMLTITPGVQTYMVSDANGCNAQTTVTITEPTPLVATSSATDELLGADGTATVNVSGGTAPYTYNWSSGGTGATETGLIAGIYSVNITDANGCLEVVEVTVGSQVGLTSINNDMNLLIYPNPAHTFIEIKNLSSQVIDEIQVFSIEGKLIQVLSFNTTETITIDVSSWSNGSYILRYMTPFGNQSIPFVKS